MSDTSSDAESGSPSSEPVDEIQDVEPVEDSGKNAELDDGGRAQASAQHVASPTAADEDTGDVAFEVLKEEKLEPVVVELPHLKPPPKVTIWKRIRFRIGSILYFAIAAAILACLGIFVWKDFTWKAWVVVGTLTTMVWAMVQNYPPDVVLLSGLGLFMVLEIINPVQALAGFSDNTVFAIALLLISCAAVEVSGVLDTFMRLLFRVSRNIRVSIFVVCFPIAIMSLVVPSIPLCAMLIPLIDKYATQFGFPVSRWMIPLSYATIVGGQGTLIGSNINLFVFGLLKQNKSPVKIGFFDIAYLGVPVIIVCFVYMCLFVNFLPDRKMDGAGASVHYSACVRLSARCPLVNLDRAQADRSVLPKVTVSAIERSNGAIIREPGPEIVFLNGDKVIFIGPMGQVKELYKIKGLRSSFSRSKHTDDIHVENAFLGRMDTSAVDPPPVLDPTLDEPQLPTDGQELKSIERTVDDDDEKNDGSDTDSMGETSLLPDREGGNKAAHIRARRTLRARRRANQPKVITADDLDAELNKRRRLLVEAVLGRESPLCGKSPDDIFFEDRYNALILAIRRAASIVDDPRNIQFRAGDLLLLSAGKDFVQMYTGSSEFTVINPIEKADLFNVGFQKKFMSLAVLTGIVICATLEVAPLSALALFGALVLMLTRSISQERARRATRAPFLITLASAFGLAAALVETDVGAEWGRNIVSIFSVMGDIGIMTGVYLGTSILTSIITSSAAVAIMMPIAHGIVTIPEYVHLGRAIYLLIMMGGSCCFATPLGYPTNLMVVGPGKYTFGDFVKFGGPIQIISSVVTIASAYLFVRGDPKT